MRPIGMFFIANIFYFLLPALNDFNPNLSAQLHYSPYQEFAQSLVNKKIEKNGLDLKTYQNVYDNKSEYYAKTIIFVNVPILALFMYMLLFKKRPYYVEHLVYTIHLYAGFMFLFAFIPLIYNGITMLLNVSIAEMIPQLLIITIVLAFIYASAKNFYQKNWFKSILITAYTFVFWFVSLAIFKFILFMLTLATT